MKRGEAPDPAESDESNPAGPPLDASAEDTQGGMVALTPPTPTGIGAGVFFWGALGTGIAAYNGWISSWTPTLILGGINIVLLLIDFRHRIYLGPEQELDDALQLPNRCLDLPGGFKPPDAGPDPDFLDERENLARGRVYEPPTWLYLLREIAGLPLLLRLHFADPVSLFDRVRHTFGRSSRETRVRDADVLATALQARMIAACRAGGMEEAPAYRAVVKRTARFVAQSENWFGAAPLVVTSDQFHVFLHLLAKAVAPLVFVPSWNQQGFFFGRSFHAKAARRRLRQVIPVAISERMTHAPPYFPARSWPFWSIAVWLRDSMEMFAIAHEFAHTVMVDDVAGDAGDSLEREVEADRFAMTVLYNDAVLRGHDPRVSLFAPQMLFTFLGTLEARAYRPSPIDHPPSLDRAAALRAAGIQLLRAGGYADHDTNEDAWRQGLEWLAQDLDAVLPRKRSAA